MAAQKILIVDNEEDILRSTSMILKVLGYDSVTLSDGRQVASVAARERPDLILQDIRMPGAHLETILESLRADPRTSNIPVALFSALPGVDQHAASFGVLGFLNKPFEREDLVLLLERAFQSRTAQGPVVE